LHKSDSRLKFKTMSEKTIAVFDKPSNQSLINELKEKKCHVFLLPQIETSALDILPNFELNHFDWLVFTDCYAVEYFLQMLEEQSLNKFELDDLRICAVGEAVSDRLRMFQVHADVIPSKLDDKSVFQAICDYELPNGQCFLITEKNTNLADLLRKANAEIVELLICQTKDITELPKLKVLIQNGAVDEVIFTSPFEVNDWKLLLSPTDFASSLNEIKPLVIDAQTFQYLYEHGLKPRYYH
jgi:uroporphyrinogen-III synthase